jgi:hypothetical protein
MQTGKIVILKGKTRHGKNRVNEHGELWQVIPLPDRTPAWPIGSMRLQSIQTSDIRWMTDDFEVVTTFPMEPLFTE